MNTLQNITLALALSTALVTPSYARLIDVYAGHQEATFVCSPNITGEKDRDATVNVIVEVKFDGEFLLSSMSSVHHTLRGGTYDRASQYHGFSSWRNGTAFAWNWEAIQNKDRNHHIVISFHEDIHNMWHYTEDHYQSGRFVLHFGSNCSEFEGEANS